MTVQDLIDALQLIEDKSQPVAVVNGFRMEEVTEIIHRDEDMSSLGTKTILLK